VVDVGEALRMKKKQQSPKGHVAMAELNKDWADMSEAEKSAFVEAMADRLYPDGDAPLSDD
jgi:hypothetical protein